MPQHLSRAVATGMPMFQAMATMDFKIGGEHRPSRYRTNSPEVSPRRPISATDNRAARDRMFTTWSEAPNPVPVA